MTPSIPNLSNKMHAVITEQQRLADEEGAIRFTEVKQLFEGMTFAVFIFGIFGWILFVGYFGLEGE